MESPVPQAVTSHVENETNITHAEEQTTAAQEFYSNPITTKDAWITASGRAETVFSQALHPTNASHKVIIQPPTARVTVFSEIVPVYYLEGKAFWNAFWQAFASHWCARQVKQWNGEITLGNIMFDRGRSEGILNDYDIGRRGYDGYP